MIPPYVWHNSAIELRLRGFDVRAVLFEGHGTNSVDMLNVRWQSWLESARDYLQTWRDIGSQSPIFQGGFSMGGDLAGAGQSRYIRTLADFACLRKQVETFSEIERRVFTFPALTARRAIKPDIG